MFRTALVAVMLLSAAPAFSGEPARLAFTVDQSTTLSMPSPVKAVKVDDATLVEVSMSGRKVTLLGLAKGSTEAVIQTADGEHRFRIYVASDRFALP
jgi:Flp pilus assembly secretin CpaC